MGIPQKQLNPNRDVWNLPHASANISKHITFSILSQLMFFFRCSSQMPWRFFFLRPWKKTLLTKKPIQQNLPHPQKKSKSRRLRLESAKVKRQLNEQVGWVDFLRSITFLGRDDKTSRWNFKYNKCWGIIKPLLRLGDEKPPSYIGIIINHD